MERRQPQKVVVVGAGPVGSLAALYAATRGDDVELYELRGGERNSYSISNFKHPVEKLPFYVSMTIGVCISTRPCVSNYY